MRQSHPYGLSLFAVERAACFRGGGAPSQLQEGGGRTLRHANRGEPPDQDAGGLSRRATVPPADPCACAHQRGRSDPAEGQRRSGVPREGSRANPRSAQGRHAIWWTAPPRRSPHAGSSRGCEVSPQRIPRSSCTCRAASRPSTGATAAACSRSKPSTHTTARPVSPSALAWVTTRVVASISSSQRTITRSAARRC